MLLTAGLLFLTVAGTAAGASPDAPLLPSLDILDPRSHDYKRLIDIPPGPPYTGAAADLSLFGTVFYDIPETLPHDPSLDHNKVFCVPLFDRIRDMCPHRPYGPTGSEYVSAVMQREAAKTSRNVVHGGKRRSRASSSSSSAPFVHSYSSFSPRMWWGPLSPSVSWAHVGLHQSPRYCLDDVTWLSSFGAGREGGEGDESSSSSPSRSVSAGRAFIGGPSDVVARVTASKIVSLSLTKPAAAQRDALRSNDTTATQKVNSELHEDRSKTFMASLPPVALVFAYRQRHRHDIAVMVRRNPNPHVLVLEVGCNKRSTSGGDTCQLAVAALSLMASHCVRCLHPTVFVHRPSESARAGGTLDDRVAVAAYTSAVGGAMVFPLQMTERTMKNVHLLQRELLAKERARRRAVHAKLLSAHTNTGHASLSSANPAEAKTNTSSAKQQAPPSLHLEPMIFALWTSFKTSLRSSGIDPNLYIGPNPRDVSAQMDLARLKEAVAAEEDEASMQLDDDDDGDDEKNDAGKMAEKVPTLIDESTRTSAEEDKFANAFPLSVYSENNHLIRFNLTYDYLLGRHSPTASSANAYYHPNGLLFQHEQKRVFLSQPNASASVAVLERLIDPEVEAIVDAVAWAKQLEKQAQQQLHNKAGGAPSSIATGIISSEWEGSVATANSLSSPPPYSLFRRIMSKYLATAFTKNTQQQGADGKSGGGVRGIFVRLWSVFHTRAQTKSLSFAPVHIPYVAELFGVVVLVACVYVRRVDKKHAAFAKTYRLTLRREREERERRTHEALIEANNKQFASFDVSSSVSHAAGKGKGGTTSASASSPSAANVDDDEDYEDIEDDAADEEGDAGDMSPTSLAPATQPPQQRKKGAPVADNAEEGEDPLEAARRQMYL